ncbi:MAG: hypothetical protein HYV09_33915 [Deltaproteobacteria bacterium]|nr:hypothetical protein [Deltaproteobacteria bacterium]
MDTPAHAPATHPFAASGPVVFGLAGGFELALYQCHPSRGTHAGDVGIGLDVGDVGDVEDVAARARASSFQVFFGPAGIDRDGRAMAVAMSPDRHFFELVGITRS